MRPVLHSRNRFIDKSRCPRRTLGAVIVATLTKLQSQRWHHATNGLNGQHRFHWKCQRAGTARGGRRRSWVSCTFVLYARPSRYDSTPETRDDGRRHSRQAKHRGRRPETPARGRHLRRMAPSSSTKGPIVHMEGLCGWSELPHPSWS